MEKQLADALATIVSLEGSVRSLSDELDEYATLEEGFFFLNEQRRLEKESELTSKQAFKEEAEDESMSRIKCEEVICGLTFIES
jgi:hypothetical protein